MPTLSVYAVSVTVGGRGSAIFDWQNKSTLANVLQKIITKYIQWNLSNTDILRIMYFFQGKNNIYLYKVGIQSSVLIKQGVIISDMSFKRGSTTYAAAQGRNCSVVYFHCITMFKALYCRTSVKGGAHTQWVNSWILTTFTQHVQTPPLTKVLRFSTCSAVTWSKYATE